LDSAARCAPRGFWGETPAGCGRRAAAAVVVGEGNADKIVEVLITPRKSVTI